jgi:hypothetical protein
MVRKVFMIVGLAALFVGAVMVVSLLFGRQSARSAAGPPPETVALAAAPEQGAVAGTYYWSFAAKFVCGVQNPLVLGPGGGVPGEPVFKPGNYATDISIHNPNYKGIVIKKKLLLLVSTNATGGEVIIREPLNTQPAANATVDLGPDAATMDDCNALYAMANNQQPPTTQFKVMSGYLVILSPLDLDVDVVYTAAVPQDVTAFPTSLSQDVLRVTGKRIFVPTGAVP